MFMPVLNQRSAVTHGRSILKRYLVAAASILLATSIGACPAFAKDSKKESEKAADAKPADAKAAADTKTADSDAPEWNAYIEELEKQVLGKWFPPGGIGKYKGVKVVFRIRKDGRLSKADIIKSSQILEVDEAATKAVNDAAPFKPFPDGVKKEDFARFEIKFDQSDIDQKRRVVTKLGKGWKPEKDDASKNSKMSF